MEESSGEESGPIDKISRRRFIERGLGLAGLAGIGGFRLNAFGGPRIPSDGFFGVQTHFGQFRPGMDHLLDLIKGAGATWIRDEVYWSEIEKKKGVFEFPPQYDGYLKAARARGIQVLLILDFGNGLYSGSEKGAPATDAERDAFARYCREVVKRYGPLGVRHFEVWNEPNASMFWKPRPSPADYARLLEAAYKACKDADPGSTVLGCSTAGTDVAFISSVLGAGGGRFMDAISFHPYRQPSPPEEHLLADTARLKALAPEKPLWITEIGYPTHTGAAGVDEETQADYLVRAFLLARTSPSIARVFWYDFQNDGEDPGEPEFNFGIVRMDGTPKPSYRAIKTMTSLVKDLVPAELRTVGDTYVLRFDGGKNGLTAVWRSGGTDTVKIPCPRGRHRLVERDGGSQMVEAKEPFLEISASESPRYLVPADRGSGQGV
jgi:hypothetical protein